jgi:hypothetical protein
MVYNTQNHWVFGLCPSPVILGNRKRFGNWMCFRPQVRRETPTLLGPLERANLNHWDRSSSEEGDTYSVGSLSKS